MNYQERKTALPKNQKAKMWWTVVLIVLALDALWLVWGLFSFNTTKEALRSAANNANTNAAGVNVEALISGATTYALTMIIVGLVIALVTLWGVYKLEGWARWLLWIGFALSVVSFNLVGLIIMLGLALAYHAVYKWVAAAPTVSTPPPAA